MSHGDWFVRPAKWTSVCAARFPRLLPQALVIDGLGVLLRALQHCQ